MVTIFVQLSSKCCWQGGGAVLEYGNQLRRGRGEGEQRNVYVLLGMEVGDCEKVPSHQ